MLRRIATTTLGLMLCASLATATPIVENTGNPSSTDSNPKYEVVSMEGMTSAYSTYNVYNTQGGRQCVLSVQKLRATQIASSFEQTTLIIWNSPTQEYVLGKKGLPNLVCVANGTEVVTPFKSKILGTEMSSYHINRKMVEGAVTADEVYIELTKKDSSKVRVKIPSDVVKQWNDVVTADLKELKKNL